MKIADILNEVMVVPDVSGGDKESVLRRLSEHLCEHVADLDLNPDVVFDALVNRERLGSTGVGEGVAIPHAKLAGLNQLVACFGRIPGGVPFDAIDGQPVRLMFVLLVPENSAGAHLKALARISRLLKQQPFRKRLLEEQGAAGLFGAFVEEDAKL